MFRPNSFPCSDRPTEYARTCTVVFVIAIVAGALGATGVAGLTMSIAKWLVLLFLVLAVVSLLL